MNFRGKKVLVAGGTGLIGTPLVEMLVSRGAEVYVVSRDDRSRAHPQCYFVNADLLDYENCLLACARMDYVFNLLCVKGSPVIAATKQATMLVSNLLLEVNLMRAARQAGVGGYLLASSLAVYPPAEVFYEQNARTDFPSKNDLFPGWAKLTGELQAEAYLLEYGFKSSIVRPANTYGPLDDFWSEGAMVIPSLIRRISGGENPLMLAGDGMQVRDFIYSGDVARGMLYVAENEIFEPVNIGSGVGVPIRNLVGYIAEAAGFVPDVVWDTSRPSGDRMRVLDTTRLKSYGFRPGIDLRDGIAETVRWYRDNKDKSNTRFNHFK